jgi:hypothetical protein
VLPYRTDVIYVKDDKVFAIDRCDEGDRFVDWFYINGRDVSRVEFYVSMELVKNELDFFEIARVFRVDLDYVKNIFDNLS